QVQLLEGRGLPRVLAHGMWWSIGRFRFRGLRCPRRWLTRAPGVMDVVETDDRKRVFRLWGSAGARRGRRRRVAHGNPILAKLRGFVGRDHEFEPARSLPPGFSAGSPSGFSVFRSLEKTLFTFAKSIRESARFFIARPAIPTKPVEATPGRA